jgi:hypothetical protein
MEYKEIFNGFINTVFKDERVELVAKQRLEKCFNCELRDGVFCSKKKEFNGVNGCGCLVAAKSRSASPCPLQKW